MKFVIEKIIIISNWYLGSKLALKLFIYIFPIALIYSILMNYDSWKFLPDDHNIHFTLL